MLLKVVLTFILCIVIVDSTVLFKNAINNGRINQISKHTPQPNWRATTSNDSSDECIIQNFVTGHTYFFLSTFKAKWEVAMDCCFKMKMSPVYLQMMSLGTREAWDDLPIENEVTIWTGWSDRSVNSIYFYREEDNEDDPEDIQTWRTSDQETPGVHIIAAKLYKNVTKPHITAEPFQLIHDLNKELKYQFVCQRIEAHQDCSKNVFQQMAGVSNNFISTIKLSQDAARKCCARSNYTLVQYTDYSIRSFDNFTESFWSDYLCKGDMPFKNCVTGIGLSASFLTYLGPLQDEYATIYAKGWECINNFYNKDREKSYVQHSSCAKKLKFVCRAPADTDYNSNKAVKPEEGSTCDPEKDCVVNGYCQDFHRCEPIPIQTRPPGEPREGRVVYGQCDTKHGKHNLYFETKNKMCNFWTFLDASTKKMYREDPACSKPHCHWKALEHSCPTRYQVFDPNSLKGEKQIITCPIRNDVSPPHNQLHYDRERRNCFVCHQVKKYPGSSEYCCNDPFHETALATREKQLYNTYLLQDTFRECWYVYNYFFERPYSLNWDTWRNFYDIDRFFRSNYRYVGFTSRFSYYSNYHKRTYFLPPTRNESPYNQPDPGSYFEYQINTYIRPKELTKFCSEYSPLWDNIIDSSAFINKVKARAKADAINQIKKEQDDKATAVANEYTDKQPE